MTRRPFWLLVSLSAAGTALAAAGCGPAAERFDKFPPAQRLLVLEAEGPVAGAAASAQALLDNPDPLYRASAAHLLAAWAAVGNPYLVLPALTQSDPLVRGIAQRTYIEHTAENVAPLAVGGTLIEVPPTVLEALAELEDPQGLPDLRTEILRVRDTLRAHLAGDEWEAALATDLLARVGDAGARRHVGALADSARPEVCAKAASACTRDDMAMGPSLLPDFYNQGTVARRAVMATLVLRPDARLSDLVARGLGDLDETVRRNAIRAAGNLGAAAPIDRLAKNLQTSSGETLDTLRALGVIGRPAAPLLRRYLLARPPADDLLAEALLAYGPQADRDDIPWIAEHLKSPSKYVRSASASALGEIAHPAAQAALMLAVDDPEPLVRACVARALGKIGTTYASRQLVVMLQDSSALVRSLAAWGLGQSRYPDAVAPLVAIARTTATATEVPLRAGRVFGRPEQAAVEALGRIGTPEAVAALLEAMESPSWLLRATAAQGFGDAHADTPAVRAALEKHLEDPVNLVRGRALLALHELGPTPTEAATEQPAAAPAAEQPAIEAPAAPEAEPEQPAAAPEAEGPAAAPAPEAP